MQNRDKQTVASARYVCYGIFIGMQNETQKKKFNSNFTHKSHDIQTKNISKFDDIAKNLYLKFQKFLRTCIYWKPALYHCCSPG